MTAFDAYAAYYDLLYKEKDYIREAAYIHDLIQRHSSDAHEILELGCGTGRHAIALTRLGYHVTGIDLSETMIAQAQKNSQSQSIEGVQFLQGDLREFRIERKFCAVLALFHVMSYQTRNSDIQAAMATAAAHLIPGGVFIFDCWFGPGVLSDPPGNRIKRLKDGDMHVTRLAEPTLYPNENRVDVNYEIFIESPTVFKRIQETHSMRYLFVPEMEMFIAVNGMRPVAVEEWLTGKVPGLESWNVCFVARR